LIHVEYCLASPTTIPSTMPNGDRTIEQWMTPESLADVRLMWDVVAGDIGKQEELRRFIPEIVLERAIA
jgi:hypothetical protein